MKPVGVGADATASASPSSPLPPATESLVRAERIVDPEHPQTLSFAGAKLALPAGVVRSSTTISIELVPTDALAALDPGMVNVTARSAGFRFLPGKLRLDEPVTIIMPYDVSKIPPGFAPEHVRTFHWNEAAGLWVALERKEVDPEQAVIISTAKELGVFIAAMVVSPDHPSQTGFAPTALRDIQVADPTAGMNLIEPPQPNHKGDARLDYLIEIPAGRNGLQPELALQYDSAGGNGWVGVGWDLRMNVVTIDTRWGVPRYSSGQETETYLLNGEQLTPVAHRGELQNRSSEKEFHTRVEGEFRKIIRHGTGPRDYWWEIVDKLGTRQFYGGGPNTGGPTVNSTLADSDGNVFLWSLRETHDTHGNFIKYLCTRVSDPGMVGGSVQGSQLYLERITYTGHEDQEGPYRVTFIRDRQLGESRRPDTTIDARGGFKMVTADLLRKVEVRLGDELIRSYVFGYQVGPFQKTLLTSLSQHGEQGELFHTHEFEYIDEVQNQLFASSTSWDTGTDDVSAPLVLLGQASALGGFSEISGGGHLYVGFNPASPTKQLSAGGKVGFSHSSSDGKLNLIDINGDDLPDKVFEDGGSFWYRSNRSGPSGTTSFGAKRLLPTLGALFEEASDTLTVGGEAYPPLSSVMLDGSFTFVHSAVYFSDVNGDGLTDLVDNGDVRFNHLSALGTPTFTTDSSVTPIPIGPGAVDATELMDDFSDQFEERVERSPLLDAVRRWVAPFGGQIRISGSIQLIENPSPECPSYPTADGVRVAIQHNGGELWMTRITAEDHAVHEPSGVDPITVARGDRIYFRVQSVFDGACDQVAWSPEIEYVGVPAGVTDVNLLDPYRYSASEDFVLAGRGATVRMPLTGTVRITGDLVKTGTTTDDITLVITQNGAPVVSLPMAWNEMGAIPLSREISVTEGDQLAFVVRTASPIDVGRIDWVPLLFYIEAEGVDSVTDQDGNFVIQIHPPYDVDLYPEDELTAPQQPWTVPTSGTILVIPNLALLPFQGSFQSELFLTVKRRGELVAKRRIPIQNGLLPPPEDLIFPLTVTGGEELFFDYSTRDGVTPVGPGLADRLLIKTVSVVYGDPEVDPVIPVPSAFHSAIQPDALTEPYRGWAYVAYNGNPARLAKGAGSGRRIVADRSVASGLSAPINESELRIDENYSLETARVYAACPSPVDGRWGGPNDRWWVAGDETSSSRLGMDNPTIPTAVPFAGARAVSRLSTAIQLAVGLSIGPVGGSTTWDATSTGEVDFMDMNGDRFPDVVGKGRVQYTTLVGGLESNNRLVSGLDSIRTCSNFSANVGVGFGVGGNPAMTVPDARGGASPSGTRRSATGKQGSEMPTLGFSGQVGFGSSDADDDLQDINGDGLPDRVFAEGNQLKVALNLGYRFAEKEPWGGGLVNDGESLSFTLGLGVGFNDGIYGLGGGVSYTQADSRADKTLMDVNGDGLLDYVTKDGDVAFNTGSGFASPVHRTGLWNDGVSTCANITNGGGAYFTIGIGPLCLAGCYVIINPGGDVGFSMSRPEAALMDLNGDGYADRVTSDHDNSISVALNRTGRTNLLRTVRRPLGATITLEYERNGNTYDEPHSRWNLSRVEVFDGQVGDGVDTLVSTFRYEGGQYNRNEREFYGYGTVVEEHRDAGNGDALYRTITRTFLNDSYYEKGLLERELMQDGAGGKFTETVHSYRFIDVHTQSPSVPLDSTTATVFPELVRTDQYIYEGEPTAGKFTFTTFTYDPLGNIVEFFDASDVGAQDDVLVTIDYFSDPANYIVGKPNRIVVTSNGVEFRRREADIEAGTGDMRQLRRYLEAGQVAVADMDYLANGNLQRIVGPANLHGERFVLAFEYDAEVQTYITGITDSFGYQSATTYELKYGTEDVVTDINGNQIDYDYDAFGRFQSITGPYQTGGPNRSLQFDYHPEADVPWALTQHFDGYRDVGDPIETVVFTDGLGRTVQIKKDATIHTGPEEAAQDRMIVSGRRTFDFVGRVVEQYYPTTEPLGGQGVFNAGYDAITPTRFGLDVLDRRTGITIPDGTSAAKGYGFGVDRGGVSQFETVVTDPNGIENKIYRDVRELVTSLRETNQGGAEVIWTSYVFDPLRQLVQIEDDQHHATLISYDNFGRRTVVDNPDTGSIERRYDQADNIVAKITDNLDAVGAAIQYDYEFIRPTAVTYPQFPGNNVTYTYGGPGAPFNRTGQITLVTDQSGSTEWFYGKLGETVKEIKTIASYTQGNSPNSPETYTTEFTHDTWGRLQEMVYPDGEVLTYHYDSGGLLASAIGVKQGFTTSYVTRLEYDQFDQRALSETGNGVRCAYSYDSLNRRLVNLRTADPSGAPFQNIHYTYDDVGNILDVQNQVPIPQGGQYGGPVLLSYTYDDLYRVVAAEGSHHYAPNKEDHFELQMAYDSIHRMLQKDQHHEVIQPSGKVIRQHQTSYQWSLDYDALQPHAPTHIGDRTFTYDANGNQTGWDHDWSGRQRSIVWDEENRIQSIADYGHVKRYKYDDIGRRVIKRGPQGETAYVNPYFTVRNRSVATKHIYTDGTRIASKLSPGFATIDSDDGTPDANFLYFYHPDQLGNTNFVTDGDGELFQHLEYFPFGEGWVREGNNTQRTPYLFSANEFDEATELYYLDPRYYDPRTSVCQTAAPLPDNYLDDLANADAETFSSLHLNVYSYGYQNPTTYSELDNRWEKTAWDVIGVGRDQSSFIEGTVVATDNGYTEIQYVDGDDVVWGVDESNEALGEYSVGEVFHRIAFELTLITVGDHEIGATHEHPFWVEGKGWVQAEDLTVGDSLVSCDGTSRKITETTCQEGVFPVFNFEVTQVHNYCVGPLAILVHNPQGMGRVDIGGSYNLGKKHVEKNLVESHHFPPKSVYKGTYYSGITIGKMPAVTMDYDDHRVTATVGGSKSAIKTRAKQHNLLKKRKFAEAMAMDIDDMRSITKASTGDPRYLAHGMEQAVDYAAGFEYKKRKLITKRQKKGLYKLIHR